jgi:hypothetical protein
MGPRLGPRTLFFFFSFDFCSFALSFCELSSWFFCGDVVQDFGGYGLLLGVVFVMLG